MLELASARITYRGREGEVVLNTSYLTGTGLGAIFAPTKSLVKASKRGAIDWQTYTESYYQLMRQAYRQERAAFETVLASQACIVFTCYCRDTSLSTRHCHRYLLLDIFSKIAANRQIPLRDLGELK